MASVDTQIDDARTRAEGLAKAVYGLTLDAVNLLTTPTLGPPGPNGLATLISPGYPGKISDIPAVPTYTSPPQPPNTDDTTVTTDAAALETVKKDLFNFFDKYFTPDTAYLAAQQWVLGTISGSAGLPSTFPIDTAWRYVSTYAQAQGNTIDGLDIPTEATTTHRTVAYQAVAPARTYVDSRIKADLWEFAVNERIRDLRSAAVLAAGNYVSALVAFETNELRSYAMVQQAEAMMAETAGAWYIAQTGGANIAAQRGIATAEFTLGGVSQGKDFEEQRIDMLTKAALEGARQSAYAAQAAYAALNAVVMDSTVGFS